MISRPLGALKWNSDGLAFCFPGNEEFLSLDDGEGVQRFSIQTGLPTVVWQSEYESLNVILRTGTDRYFVGGSYGIAYDLKVGSNGDWRLQGQRRLLDYFDCAAFAESEQLLAVCWYHKVVILPLEENDARKPVEVVLGNKRIFSVDWVPGAKRFLVMSPKGLFSIGLNGRVDQLPTPDGEVLAAARISDSGEFACAVGSGDLVTVFAARLGDPRKHLWTVSFEQQPRPHKTFHPQSTMRSAGMVYSGVNDELVLSCCDTVRRIDRKGGIKKTIRLPNIAPRVAVSPNAEYVVAGSVAGLYVLNQEGTFVEPRTCHGVRVVGFIFSNDERRLYSNCTGFSEVLCWDVETATRNWGVCWAGSGQATLVCTEDAGLIICRNVSTSYQAAMARLDEDGNETVLCHLEGFSVKTVQPDSAHVLIACRQFGKPARCELLEFPTGHNLCSATLGEHEPAFVAIYGHVACIHDRHHIWVVNLTENDNAYDIAHATEDNDLEIFMDSESTVIAISKSGIYKSSVKMPRWETLVKFDVAAIAAGRPVSGRLPIALENNTVEIRNTSDWSVSRTETVVFQDATISACTISPSGRYLAVGASNGKILLCTLG